MTEKNPHYLLVFIVILVLAACCTGSRQDPAIETPEVAVSAVLTSVTPTPVNAMGCIEASDCVPAACCHPDSCINKVAQPDCDDFACTASCEGPLDCGAGSCGCVQGQCTVIASVEQTPVVTLTTKSASAIRIWATPNRYSPVMSSTPGLELSLITPAGMDTSTVVYDWTASYGAFLSWSPPDYAVHQKGSSVTTNGGKIYWSYTDKPTSTASPVIITMTARDTATKKEVGHSVLTLDWDGESAVIVRDIT